MTDALTTWTTTRPSEQGNKMLTYVNIIQILLAVTLSFCQAADIISSSKLEACVRDGSQVTTAIEQTSHQHKNTSGTPKTWVVLAVSCGVTMLPEAGRYPCSRQRGHDHQFRPAVCRELRRQVSNDRVGNFKQDSKYSACTAQERSRGRFLV